MDRTLAQEWQYGRVWGSEAGRAGALPTNLDHYNWSRVRTAPAGAAAYVSCRRRKQPIGTQHLAFVYTLLIPAIKPCRTRLLSSNG